MWTVTLPMPCRISPALIKLKLPCEAPSAKRREPTTMLDEKRIAMSAGPYKSTKTPDKIGKTVLMRVEADIMTPYLALSMR